MVRRASKFLAAATWNGGNYPALIRDPAELSALPNREQIRAVVVNLSVPPERLMPHHRVVQAWWEQRRAASHHFYIGPVTRRDQTVPDAVGVMVRPSGETW